MKDWSNQTIIGLAKRSDIFVLIITIFFAMVGAFFALFFGGQSIWGMWIPLCFLTIPTLHYLCREVLILRKRISELERKQVEKV